MAALSPTIATARNRHNVLIRHRGPDDPAVAEARRALALVQVEQRIRDAIATAPPLDADTLARIRALIPAVAPATEPATSASPSTRTRRAEQRRRDRA